MKSSFLRCFRRPARRGTRLFGPWLSALLAVLAAGSLPAMGANVPDGFEDTLVVGGLNQPVGFTFLPDGRIIFIQQVNSRVRLIVDGRIGSNDPLVYVPNVNTEGIERGLLGIDVDPGWPDRPYIYVYYSHDGTNTNYLSMFTVTGDLTDPHSDQLFISGTSRYDILTDIPDNAFNQNGGTVRFGIDGKLYVSIGDDEDQCESEDTSSLQGVILRLDVSSLPGSGSGPPPKSLITPADNPFSGDANTNLVFCYGLRNPFRFNVDPVTGDLFIGDVGLADYEEMDRSSGGENFGWPYREAYMVRNPFGCDDPPGTEYDDPIHYYDRSGYGSASIISAGLYRPVDYPNDRSFPPEYDGDCFYVEYYQGWMVRITDTGSGWEVAPPVAGQPSAEYWADGLNNASDFLIGPDGALYYIEQFSPFPDPGSLRRIGLPGPPEPNNRIVAGPGPAYGNQPLVRVFPPEPDAQWEVEFTPYGSPHYGVNVSCGDLDGDLADDIITGAGPGPIFGPHVRGFAADGSPLPGLSFLAYGTNKWGVNVAAGDIDADGYDEVITGAGPGAVFGPHVRAFDYDGGSGVAPVPGVSFFAYGTPKWGVNVSAGDINGDGRDEILTGAGPGAVYGPHVRGWTYDPDGSPPATSPIPGVSFLAYGTNKWGVNVAAGDVDADGIDEILTGAGPGQVFGAHVRGWNYDGAALQAISGISFFAWPPGDLRYGAKVCAIPDLDGDGRAELVVGPGPDPAAGTPVKVFTYNGSQTAEWFSLDAFPGMTHGTGVAAGHFGDE